MDTRVKKKIEKLQRLLWLEKNEENAFYEQQFRNFSMAKIEVAVKNGICWYPLSFENSITDNEGLIKVKFRLPPNLQDEHSFQPGSSVKIFSINAETGFIGQFTEGIIDLIIPQKRVEISCSAKKTQHWMQTETAIGIHLSFSKYTYTVMEKSLDDILRADDNRLAQLRDVMLGNEPARFIPGAPFHSDWLNPSQQEAVNLILSAQDIALVHGPPGTGKTTTLVEAIIETLKSESRVMVCAYNNIAVDVVVEKLMERGVSVVRIGNPAKVTDELLNITYDAQYYAHPYYSDLLSCKATIKQLKSDYARTPPREGPKRIAIRREIGEYIYYRSVLELSIKSAIFKENQVVAATMIGSSFNILKGMSFSTVFMDEAAQALEPACWTPVTKANRVIFAGDHRQLPPTVKSYEAAQNGLMHTLFERIMERKPECSVLLTTQYRMHETIMNFSSQQFYENRLIAAPSVRDKTLIDNDIPVEWIDTSQSLFSELRQMDGTSIYNREEAHLMFSALFDYMEKIGEARILEEKITVGVISPYSAQVDLFRQQIREYNYFEQFLSNRLITIRTIDGFQGQERDIIAISLVRSNRNARIGFLADYRRINVAMTRARKKLLIIGDSSTLRKDPFYESLFLYVQKNGSVTTLSDSGFNGRLDEIIADVRKKLSKERKPKVTDIPVEDKVQIDSSEHNENDLSPVEQAIPDEIVSDRAKGFRRWIKKVWTKMSNSTVG
ncbi:MAG: AAA family ATPase [Tannerella sp.]|jgi:hypothetical protein|nr:AAA family ATPase [Tannerella sp.]